MHKLFAIDIEECERVLHVEHSDKFRFGAFYHFHHFAFGFVPFAPRIEQHTHAVAVERTAHATFGNKHEFAAIVGHQIGLFGHRLAVERTRYMVLPQIHAVFTRRHH